jgi:hypothetical protein
MGNLGVGNMMRQFMAVFLTGLLLAGVSPRLWAQGTEPETEEWTIPEGTEFKLQLHTTVNSKTTKAGDRVMSTLIDPVAVEDREVLPKGVRIDGHVVEVKEAARKGKGGYIYIQFDTVELPTGEKVAIVGSLTEIFASEGNDNSMVGVEGELKGRGASRKTQLGIIAAMTGAGAAAGVGPGIAAGVSSILVAVILPRGKQATLEAGSLVGMRLDRDVSFALPASE